jgi:glycosyltransferase involved in cell wall biosynthesis
MRVGVLLDPNNINTQPNVGGGYTFEQEVFKAFLDLAVHNQNEFVVFLSKESPQKISQVKGVEFIYLAREWKRFDSVILALLRVFFDRIKYAKIYFTQSTINSFKYEVNRRILESHKIDIVWSLLPSNITLDIPYIVTVWDLAHRNYPYFPEVSSGTGWDSREYAFRTLLRRATYVVTGTQVGKSEVEKNYQVSSDRIKVLPFPTPQFALDVKPLNPHQTLEKYGLELNSYLFYPAQFWPHKNHANLLYAIKLLNDYYDLRFPVVFVGSDKKNKNYIKQLVEDLDLQHQVRFLGFVKQEDLIALYQGAFALTFMSFFGPDNLPPLEAFALGCPVIASNVSGAQEQLGDAALLVNPSDDKQIALAIKSLYEDSNLRQKLTQRGYERAAQWTSQDYVRGIFGILEEFQAIRRCWLVD